MGFGFLKVELDHLNWAFPDSCVFTQFLDYKWIIFHIPVILF